MGTEMYNVPANVDPAVTEYALTFRTSATAM